jgi:hypothetical protein
MVDLRRGLPTLGEWQAFHPDEDNKSIGLSLDRRRPGFCLPWDVADVMDEESKLLQRRDRARIVCTDPDVAIVWALRRVNLR